MTSMPDSVVTSRNVSNSEVTTFLSCKRMYRYAFVENLEPKAISVPLTRGTLGHLAFEYYVKARLNNTNHERSLKYAMEAFLEATKNGVPIDLVMETQFLWTRYMEVHRGWPEWRLLGSEERVDLRLTDSLNMPIRYDLYVEDIATGKFLIGDYKFTYDFWSVEDHDMNGQMPKYVVVMQANNIKVDGGFIEEVRTRKLGTEKSSDPKNLWRRTFYYPSFHKKRTMLKQHVAASMEIEKFRSLSESEQKDNAIPVLNKHGACKYCNFKSLCNSENEGKTDLSVDIRTDYKQNTYGYNNQQMIMEDLI